MTIEEFTQADGTISCSPGSELIGCLSKSCPQQLVDGKCPVEEVCTNRKCEEVYTWYNV